MYSPDKRRLAKSSSQGTPPLTLLQGRRASSREVFALLPELVGRLENFARHEVVMLGLDVRAQDRPR